MLRPHLPSLTVAVLMLAIAPLALAASGRPKLQAFFESSLVDSNYQQKVFTRVAKAWRQPSPKQAPQPGRRTIVQAVLGRDGKLASVMVSTESGSKAWDAAALSAVRKAAPFPPLPTSHASPTVEVHFHVAWVADQR